MINEIKYLVECYENCLAEMDELSSADKEFMVYAKFLEDTIDDTFMYETTCVQEIGAIEDYRPVQNIRMELYTMLRDYRVHLMTRVSRES